MTDTVPPGRRIDRASLERIIQRAAELQATERDLSEGLTEQELLHLGEEVGLSPSNVRRALLEERTRATVARDRGLGVFLAGPRYVTIERVIAQPAPQVTEALHWWMEEVEVLQVKRRFQDVMVWETRRGALAAVKRSLGPAGRQRHLTHVKDVTGSVADLGDARSHVRLVADISNERKGRIAGAITLAGVGGAATAFAAGIGVELWAASLALPLGGIVSYSIARSQWQVAQKAELALEQVLDRLEHGEIEVPRRKPGPRQSPWMKIADEIRRSFDI